jgi:hypothetical protein
VCATNLTSFISGVVFGIVVGSLRRFSPTVAEVVIPVAFFSTLLLGVVGVPEIIAQVRRLYLPVSSPQAHQHAMGCFRSTLTRALIWLLTFSVVALTIEHVYA